MVIDPTAGDQIALASISLYCLANICVKSTVFLLYLRIFRFSGTRRLIAWAVIGINAAYFTAAFFACLFSCNPWKKALYPHLRGHCINQYHLALGGSVLTILTDIVACLLPVRDVVKLRMSRFQKFQVIAVFAAGLLYASS